MATITVRDLDESTRSALRLRAARNGRSMEAEVRLILEQAVSDDSAGYPPLGTHIRAAVESIGGADELIRHIPPRIVDWTMRIPDLDDPRFGDPDE